MKKLSKAQNEALRLLILDEYRAHRRDNDPKARNTRVHGGGVKSVSYKALERNGILTQRDGSFEMDFTDIGHKIAIDLLHEGAFAEMTSDFELRKMEEARKASELKIKHAIVNTHLLQWWEVDVYASHRYYDETGYEYTVDFNQDKGTWNDGTPRRDDLVRINYNRADGYHIGTSGTHLYPTTAKRMAELMLIAVQIIDSGILIEETPALVSATRPNRMHTRCQPSQYAK